MTAQNPPTWQVGSDATVRPSPELSAQVLTQAFVWMFAGLLVTAIAAFGVLQSDSLYELVGRNYFIAAIVVFVFALAIQAMIRRLNAVVALALFFIFSALVGLTTGVIVAQFTRESVAAAFLSASSIFGAAALYGYATKRPLVRFQQYIPIVVIGWLVAVVVNVIIGSSMFSMILSLFTVALFTALTAYDVKRLQQGDYIDWTGSPERAAVLGAVHLYIAFINIFLSLLNLMGDRD